MGITYYVLQHLNFEGDESLLPTPTALRFLKCHSRLYQNPKLIFFVIQLQLLTFFHELPLLLVLVHTIII